MSDLALKIENVSKEYRLGAIGGTTLRDEVHRFAAKYLYRTKKSGKDGKKFMALQDINLEVKKGERLAIIGHNGAGKSTLLKLLARVTAPTTGTISYNGRISSMLEVGTGFHGELTGRENVYMNGAILGMRKWEIDKKLEQIVEFAEMAKFIDTPVKRYSSGMYVKLAFSVAAHLDSDIMIMDEVLAVGDIKFQQKCLGRMDEASEKEGRTILFVSHNMSAVNKLCNTGYLLSQGKGVFLGTAAEAVTRYISEISNTSSEVNVPVDIRKKIQITNIRNCLPDGQTADSFSTEETIQLAVGVVAQNTVGAEELRIQLLDSKKNIVFTNNLSVQEFLASKQSHLGIFTYPANTFTSGRYSWNIHIHYPNVECLDKYNDVCPFTIVDTTTPFAKYRVGTYGSVFMNYKLDGRNYLL